jgi:hypothetical protein
MPTLTDIQANLGLIESLLESTDDPEALQQLDDACLEALSDLKTKVDSYIYLIRKLNAEADFLLDESKRMADLGKSKKALSSRLKSHLLNRLTDENMKRLNTDYYTVSVCSNGGKSAMKVTEDLPYSEFPSQYVYTEIKPDLDVIRAECEKSPFGIIFDGSGNEIARLLPKSQHLRIK